MKTLASLFAWCVFCFCSIGGATCVAQDSGYTPPPASGDGYTPPPPSGGGYTPPPASGGGYAPPPPTHGGYTPPEVYPSDDWLVTAWGSFSGTTLIHGGSQLIKWGLTSIGVLIADDGTVVGVVDNPLILIGGGTVVAGGVVLVLGGAKVLIETWFN